MQESHNWDWVPSRASPRNAARQEPILLQTIVQTDDELQRARSNETVPWNNNESQITETNETIPRGGGDSSALPETITRVIFKLPKGRSVSRKLSGIQLFMITLNGTLGTGLYGRGGQMLELGGPLAVFLSFIIVGFLAWAVMQCITEMLCIWPVPGALSVFVSEFVDTELGIAVGVAYWFTYSVSFSALVVAAASELEVWTPLSTIGTVAFYVLVPLSLVFINTFKVEIYGHIETFSGVLKLFFLTIILILLPVINVKDKLGVKDWESLKTAAQFDKEATRSGGTAFLMAMSISTYAYVGVEIVAASALEARWSKPQQRTKLGEEAPNIRRTIKASAVYFTILAAIAYTLGGLFVSFDVDRSNCDLPRLSWIGRSDNCSFTKRANSTSAFVIIAKESSINNLDNVFNAFLLFTALTCANTNLFVASRTLFGLTARLVGGTGRPRLIRVLAYFGKTNRDRVPIRALLFSAVAFCWVPFLRLIHPSEDSQPSAVFGEVLAQMGSLGVVIVWACNCIAFLRYYYCIKKHQAYLREENIPRVRRAADDYPYRSHLQPVLAWVALGGCLFILVVANGSFLWDGFHYQSFLSTYLATIAFLLFWIVLKLAREANWSWVDLSRPSSVAEKIRNLHDKRFEATSS